MTTRKVLVVGALGVVGRAVMEHLHGRPDVLCAGLSRRSADFARDAIWIAADLRDAQATRQALAEHGDVTHLVYAALNEQPDLLKGWRDPENVAINTRMLANTLEALDGAPLAHVTLMQGTKAYGVHTGRAMRIPAREQDAVRDHANFYFDQQDMLEQQARRQGFGWTIFRPQIVLGVALGSAMNPVATLGAYAALLRESGQPLAYPGHPELLTECTDARLIARAVEWAWDAPQAWGEVFNIANGDVMAWRHLFERLAEFFGMPAGELVQTRMRQAMPAEAQVWREMARREGLHVNELSDLIGLSWQYADATWSAQHPLPFPPLVSTIKLRQAGFGDCIDSELSVLENLRRMQALGYLPR
ncbi:NAD-dependent epimerase/dehydratase family protein [Achromobacter aegrifaciens]|uniref:NAD-dependent epimerase/dehydratase family protein n=1 Tax=Achromobacter aegrifaciens TaxID=1287736 RepID=A0ABU2DFS7_ACHAE|nr:NAD-dependent epimerase/dehydratase family protein [Achromobacter aegrifaciens]MDR7946969.1 NAD-dependent epimerase/dehydratase family protein [Achromobacter aegrifaciens]